MDTAAKPAQQQTAPSDGDSVEGVLTDLEDSTVNAHRKVVTAMATAAVGLGTVVSRLTADPSAAPVSYTSSPAAYVPSIDSPEMSWWRESMKTHDQRIAWFRNARFGMFIHWGV